MFIKADGPTALHPDLVRSLSFANGQADVDTPEGTEPAIAALASVWNGKRGFVAVVLRFLKSPRVDRYVYSEAIASEATFKAATAEGLAFAEGLGFAMDASDFASLPPELRTRRLKNWNKLRKVRRARPGTSEDESGKAVLGKIALERRRGGGRWTNPIERLLAFF